MTLDTAIFPFADDSLPVCMPEMVVDWTPTNFTDGFENHRAIAQDVYRHLSMFEDLDAINDGRYLNVTDTWSARVYRDAPAAWQTLYKTALTQDQEYTEGFGCPYYHQPSLWLLHEEWMRDNACDFVVDAIPSITFHEETVGVMERLVYPYTEYESLTATIMQCSNQEIIAKLKAGEIQYDDILEEIIDQFSDEETVAFNAAWLCNKSAQEIADLIEDGKVECESVPDEIYGEVWSIIRQK